MSIKKSGDSTYLSVFYKDLPVLFPSLIESDASAGRNIVSLSRRAFVSSCRMKRRTRDRNIQLFFLLF